MGCFCVKQLNHHLDVSSSAPTDSSIRTQYQTVGWVRHLPSMSVDESQITSWEEIRPRMRNRTQSLPAVNV
jgi:hypothetical protein